MLGEHQRHLLDVVVRNLDEVGDEVSVAGAVGLDALGTGAAVVDAVVAVGAANDDLLVGGATALLDEPGEFQRRVDRLGSRAAQEDPTVGMGRALGDQLGEFTCRVVGEGGEGVEGDEIRHLLGDGVDDLGSAMADLAIPEAGHAIEVGLAGVVVDRRAFASDDVDVVGLGRCRFAEGMKQVIGDRHDRILRERRAGEALA